MEYYNYLKIAEYVVNLKNIFTTEGNLYFPLHIGAFCERSKNITTDFTVTIERAKELDEPDDGLITKMDEGQNPYWIYKDKSGNYLWYIKNSEGHNKVSFFISSDWSSFKVFINSNYDGVSVFNNFGNIFAYSILNYNSIMFHGITIEYKGKGIIILASSGTGKTTHARMWRDSKNALIINGDRTICRKLDNVWYAYGSPWFGTSGECINRRVPISAMVILERGKKNEVFRLKEYEAIKALIQRVYAPNWNENLMEKALDKIDSIIRDIPVLNLKCKPDFEAVEVLERAIELL